MENICIIGADALTQFITLKLNTLYPHIKIYVAPGNGVTDLNPNVINLSVDIYLSEKTVNLLRVHNITHIVVLDSELLLKGAIEFFQGYGFITQVGSTKSSYLCQKISQQRLWSERFEIPCWPYELCHSTERLQALLENDNNLQILTEAGMFAMEVPSNCLSSIKMQSIPFSTFVVQKKSTQLN